MPAASFSSSNSVNHFGLDMANQQKKELKKNCGNHIEIIGMITFLS